MFCIYLRTNSDLCHLQHKLIGFYNRDVKCLQRGTDWVFKYSGLHFVFKGLKRRCKIFFILKGPFFGCIMEITFVLKLYTYPPVIPINIFRDKIKPRCEFKQLN